MCCYFDKLPVKHIAYEDITTYKVVDITYKEKLPWYIRLFIIKPNNPKYIKEIRSVIYTKFTYSFNKIEKTILKDISKYNNGYVSGGGFYSYEHCKDADVNFMGDTVKCIIPKGSTFYYDTFKHVYISNQLKIVEIL